MKLYPCSAVEKLFAAYADIGGTCYEIVPGTLGHGLTVCVADGYNSAIVTEVYLNEWSSAHKIRFYDVLPKKYAKMIEAAC